MTQAEAMRMARTMRKGYSSNLLSSPKIIANAISRAVNSKHPRARYRRGVGSGAGLFLHAVLPTRWWDALMRKLL